MRHACPCPCALHLTPWMRYAAHADRDFLTPGRLDVPVRARLRATANTRCGNYCCEDKYVCGAKQPVAPGQSPARSTTAAHSSSSACARVRVRSLRPHVRDRLRGVWQHEHPAPVWLDDPHPVCRVHRAVARGLDDGAHHRALCRPRGRHRPPEQVRGRDAAVDLAERQPGARDQSEQPGERGDPVDRPAEFRHDETTTAVSGQDHVLFARGMGQRVHRRRGPMRLDAVEAAHLLRHPRRGHGKRDPAGVPLGRDQVKHDEQRAIVVHERAVLVDQEDPLAHGIEPHAERRAGRGHELGKALHVGAALGERLGGEDSSSRLLTVSTSTPIRPSRPGSTTDAVPPAQSTTIFSPASLHAGHVDAAHQFVRVGLHHPGREGQFGDLAREGAAEFLP